jgi:hypothetical protein
VSAGLGPDYEIGPVSLRDIVRGYSELVRSRVDAGWAPSMLTFMFRQLPGGKSAVLAQMRREVERRYARLDEADLLLNDLEGHPHAFVIACVMDRQVKAERAWLIPHAIARKLGDFSIETLARLSQPEIRALMAEPTPLHHFVDTMSRHLWSAVQRITRDYASDALGIWEGRPLNAEVVYRFLEFGGVGPKVASMADNILARDFKVSFADYYSIDVWADVNAVGRPSLPNKRRRSTTPS